MKNLIKTLKGIGICMMAILFLTSQQAFAQLPDSKMEILYRSSITGLPNFIKFNTGNEVKVQNFSEWAVQAFELPSTVSFKAYNTEKDDLGYTHTRYREYVNNIQVNGTMLIVHSKDGMIKSVNGDYFQNLKTAYSSSISESTALKSALKKVNAKRYKWQNTKEESSMREAMRDPSFSYFPKGELVIAHKADAAFSAESMRLAFKFNIYAEEPLYRANVFVDAVTGEIILEENLLHFADAVGTANTRYSGNVALTSDNYGTGQYRLRETGRGNGISTYNCNNSTSYTNTDFTNSSSTWNITGANQVATDAHWGAEKTYDYYYQKFNRNSIDNNGFALLSYVHYNNNFENAFWDGNRMTYGDGNAANNTNPFTCLDICGHEVTHGLTSKTAELGYSGEPGTLNEGFSDIFGTCIEAFAKPAKSDWIMGSDFTTNGKWRRSLSNPNTYGQPDTYKGTNWDNGGEVHTNDGPCDYWFYLLCEGGSGTNDINNTFNVTGITMDKASKIAFRALTVYFTSTTNYADARKFSIQAAIDLYGSCSQETQSTTNAWYAVGVGAQYVAAPVTADFSAVQTSSCSVPVTIQFSNGTVNGSSFTWNFGDGSTSTGANPSHTYTSAGTYAVSLKALGCTGTTDDSEVKNNYIVINPPAAPTVTGASRCGAGTVTLSANATGTAVWYDGSGNVINTGANYTTPVLAANTTYYVSSVNQAANVTGGPTSPSIGTSAAFNLTTRYLIFDVLQPCTLKTVDVNASGAGNRTVQLRDSVGNHLDSIVVNMPNGLSTITLNFSLTPGQKYQLALSETSAANLIRNSAGAVFPYNIGSLVSITGTNATAGYYYFYYNWVVQPVSCNSASIPVVATIDPIPVISFNYTGSSLCSNGTAINLNASPVGGTYTGTGIVGNQFNPNGLLPANYILSYNYTSTAGCSNSDTANIIVKSCSTTGTVEIEVAAMEVFPNPAYNKLYIKSPQVISNIELTDMLGKQIFVNKEMNKQNVSELDVSGLPSGFYFVKVITDNNEQKITRIIKQ